MAYLLDSDIVIDYLSGRDATVRLVGHLFPDSFSIGVVTYMEVYEGTIRGPNGDHLRGRLDTFVATTPTLPFTPEIARTCAHLRDDLRRRGRPVHPRYLDLINAATALEFDLTLVTRNTLDYDDIPGLRLNQ